MGSLADYQSSEQGQGRMDTIRAQGANVEQIVDSIATLAVEYDNYRKSLDPVVDADDIAFSDASLTQMCSDLSPKFAVLTTDQKGWVNQVIAGLGIPLTV